MYWDSCVSASSGDVTGKINLYKVKAREVYTDFGCILCRHDIDRIVEGRVYNVSTRESWLYNSKYWSFQVER